MRQPRGPVEESGTDHVTKWIDCGFDPVEQNISAHCLSWQVSIITSTHCVTYACAALFAVEAGLAVAASNCMH